MTKSCKQLLQTHLPKSPDMDSLSSESLSHSTTYGTNVAASQGIGHGSETTMQSWETEGEVGFLSFFFFLWL